MHPINTLPLQLLFNELDKNGDGHVSIDELAWLLESTGLEVNRDKLELLVGDKALGPLDFLFFCQALMINGDDYNVNVGDEICQVDEMMLERDLREAFRVFDLNDDGYISCQELQIALSRLGLWDDRCRRDSKEMIGAFDINSDGLLDFEEFKVMMFLDSFDSSN